MSELKPCPFCGSNPKTYVVWERIDIREFVIACPKCGVCKRHSSDMRGASFEDYENVFAQTIFEWNERV